MEMITIVFSLGFGTGVFLCIIGYHVYEMLFNEEKYEPKYLRFPMPPPPKPSNLVDAYGDRIQTKGRNPFTEARKEIFKNGPK